MKIRLTESDLKQLVYESVKRILKEDIEGQTSNEYKCASILAQYDKFKVESVEAGTWGNTGTINLEYDEPDAYVTLGINYEYDAYLDGEYDSGDFYFTPPSYPDLVINYINPTNMSWVYYDSEGDLVEEVKDFVPEDGDIYFKYAQDILSYNETVISEKFGEDLPTRTSNKYRFNRK
jgi:hypothetical protein